MNRTTERDPLGVAALAQQRISVLAEVLNEARAERDDAVRAMLASGYGVNATAREIGVTEGLIRQIRRGA